MIQSFKTFESDSGYKSYKDAHAALMQDSNGYKLYRMVFVQDVHGDWRYEASGWREGFDEEKK